MSEPKTAPAGGFKKALMVFNPAAGRGRLRRLEAVLDGLGALGCRYELFRTAMPGDAENAARMAIDGGFDLLVAAGGDGTVNELANGLAAADSQLPLAFLPLGTANVLAAEIGLAATPKAVLAMIGGGRRRSIRLGRVDGRHFLLMASAGLDAAVVRHVDLVLKRHTGQLAYAVEALRQTLAYDFPPFAVTIDGAAFEARMVVVCKARCYGGPFLAAPKADLSEPRFEVILLEDGGLKALLRYGLGLVSGRLPVTAGVRIVPGRRVAIDGPLGAPVQADGDLVAALPIEASLSDRSITLVTP